MIFRPKTTLAFPHPLCTYTREHTHFTCWLHTMAWLYLQHQTGICQSPRGAHCYSTPGRTGAEPSSASNEFCNGRESADEVCQRALVTPNTEKTTGNLVPLSAVGKGWRGEEKRNGFSTYLGWTQAQAVEHLLTTSAAFLLILQQTYIRQHLKRHSACVHANIILRLTVDDQAQLLTEVQAGLIFHKKKTNRVKERSRVNMSSAHINLYKSATEYTYLCTQCWPESNFSYWYMCERLGHAFYTYTWRLGVTSEVWFDFSVY